MVIEDLKEREEEGGGELRIVEERQKGQLICPTAEMDTRMLGCRLLPFSFSEDDSCRFIFISLLLGLLLLQVRKVGPIYEAS